MQINWTEERNLTMLTDYYEFTMSNGYFLNGMKDRVAVFDMFFRKVPDRGGFGIMAGLEQLVDEDSELISLYYGEEIKEEDAQRFVAEIEEKYPDVDVDAHYGGQPIYYYVLAVE